MQLRQLKITEDRQIPSQTSAANVQKRVYQLQLSCSSRLEHQFVRDIYIYMYNHIYNNNYIYIYICIIIHTHIYIYICIDKFIHKLLHMFTQFSPTPVFDLLKSNDLHPNQGFGGLAIVSIWYIYIYGPVLRLSTPPWVGSPGSSPNSLLFASYWQHFWGPASYLLGLCSISDYQPRIY